MFSIIFNSVLLFLIVLFTQTPGMVKVKLCTFSPDKKPVEAYLRIYSLPDSTLIKSDYSKGKCEVYLPLGNYHIVYKRCGSTSFLLKADRNKQIVTFLNNECDKQ